MSDIKSSVLYGAIIGDVVGSPYEGSGRTIKTKDFELFGDGCHFTDDTVMTIAVADALLTCNGLNESDVKAAVTKSMQRWGRKYPKAGYGHRFKGWIKADNPHPYKSFGNGAAMRMSPVALIAYISNHFEFAGDIARWTAEVTHNHPEAVKSVEAVAGAINLAQHGISKDEIKAYVEGEFGYDLSRTLDEIRPTYDFEVSAEKSVPEAIIAFLESTDFEDAIRNAVSLGGDADTQAAIAGSIAEAFYGVPDALKQAVREKLTLEMIRVLDEINRVVRLQEDCHELHGNEDIDDAMRFFRMTTSPDDLKKLLYTIHRRIQDDGCFIVPMEKVSEGDNYKPLTVDNEQANITFMSVFTNFYAFNKARRDNPQLKCTTTPIKNLLDTCAQVNAKVQNSDAPANMGLAINPFSDEVFGLTPKLIDVILSHVDDTVDTSTVDEFDAEKAQAYKDLVAKAKNQYPEYNPKVKPSAADEQRTRDFADKFADKHKFWEALECRCAKWEESTDADINDKR
ncbi:MAG: ADP-ribosylglycohydrolase family protein, partial [Selenomonadaceae bacterium]|nr:ADP-ribosylglycohydrolase family protein [Selenomonadaceae bacterium]